MTGLWGRAAHLARLDELLRHARAGQPSVVVLAGDSGIGKTALLRALAERGSGDFTVSWARGLADEATPAFWLWRAALGASVDQPDASDDRFALFESLRGELVERAPLLLLIDDVQWLDEPSLRALTYVVRRLTDEHLLIAATLRTDEAGEGWRSVGSELLTEMAVQRLDVLPLGDEDSARCLEAGFGGPLPEELADRGLALGRGNPFYLRELGRFWAVDASRDVPHSVAGLVKQRLSRLPAPTQEFLLAASVIGEQAEIAVVADCLGRPAAAVLPAVQESLDARLVEHAGPGSVRFPHALVRAALLDSVPMQQLVSLHHRAAGAIERLYADALDEHLPDLARHAAAAAVAGDREPALRWGERAALAAMRHLAWEEAARLARLALEAGAAAVPDSTRSRLLLLVASAASHAGQLHDAAAACREAVAIARRTSDDASLVAAAMTLDPVGELAWDRELHRWCLDALAVLAPDAAAGRAKLTARLGEILMYLGEWSAAVPITEEALVLAETAGDPDALIAALRARNLALSAPEHRDERVELAARMTRLGEQLARPDVEMWGLLWTIDALFERGELAAVAGELTKLRWCADRTGSPIARWHWLHSAAAHAQAVAHYDEALELAGEGFEIMRTLRHPAGFGAYMSLITAVGRHRGYPEMALTPQPDLEPDEGEVRAELFAHIGPAFALADAGRITEAEIRYLRPGPPPTWRIPPYFRVALLGIGSQIALTLGRWDDVRWFVEQLEPYRDAHVVTTAGSGSYFGPVELFLGRCAAGLGDTAAAARSFGVAIAAATRSAAPGFLVEAKYELALLLADTGRRTAAEALLTEAEQLATNIAMTAWLDRIRTARAAAAADPLSPREREVAELVAQGLTNREIAEHLVLSERTAANHVQHVLTKLGFARRSEIAAWIARQ